MNEAACAWLFRNFLQDVLKTRFFLYQITSIQQTKSIPWEVIHEHNNEEDDIDKYLHWGSFFTFTSTNTQSTFGLHQCSTYRDFYHGPKYDKEENNFKVSGRECTWTFMVQLYKYLINQWINVLKARVRKTFDNERTKNMEFSICGLKWNFPFVLHF